MFLILKVQDKDQGSACSFCHSQHSRGHTTSTNTMESKNMPESYSLGWKKKAKKIIFSSPSTVFEAVLLSQTYYPTELLLLRWLGKHQEKENGCWIMSYPLGELPKITHSRHMLALKTCGSMQEYFKYIKRLWLLFFLLFWNNTAGLKFIILLPQHTTCWDFSCVLLYTAGKWLIAPVVSSY